MDPSVPHSWVLEMHNWIDHLYHTSSFDQLSMAMMNDMNTFVYHQRHYMAQAIVPYWSQPPPPPVVVRQEDLAQSGHPDQSIQGAIVPYGYGSQPPTVVARREEPAQSGHPDHQSDQISMVCPYSPLTPPIVYNESSVDASPFSPPDNCVPPMPWIPEWYPPIPGSVVMAAGVSEFMSPVQIVPERHAEQEQTQDTRAACDLTNDHRMQTSQLVSSSANGGVKSCLKANKDSERGEYEMGDNKDVPKKRVSIAPVFSHELHIFDAE